MTGVLEGVKVVEMGQILAAPAAAGWMGDWGAEVIKVEPLSGEFSRGVGSQMGVAVGAVKGTFELSNHNKRGLAVDLKQESGRDIFYQLIQRADVFVSNYMFATLKRLKLDYASLSQINPGLIYCLVTSYGTVGPDKDEPGWDITAGWARSGIQYTLGEAGQPPPMGRLSMVDRIVGGYAVAGICAALLHKEKTGKGQELELSLYHSGVWTCIGVQSALMGMPDIRYDRTKPGNPLLNLYRTEDNQWLQLRRSEERNWPVFCRAIERPDLENDPRFKTLELRKENEELIRILDEVFASKNCEEWEKHFRENNLMPGMYGRVTTPLEVTTDPQALANNFFVEVEHPVAGKIKLVSSPIKFRQNPASIRTTAPEIGQHNEEILLELGYRWEDIAQLKEQEVIL